jgi:sRNA-binding carbon storage regulator CsrA
LVVGEATVVITKVSGNRVSLGVEAPDEVAIVRGECSPYAQARKKVDATTGWLIELLGPALTPWGEGAESRHQWRWKETRGEMMLEWDPLKRDLQLLAISMLNGHPVSVKVFSQPTCREVFQLALGLGIALQKPPRPSQPKKRAGLTAKRK